MVKKNLTFVKTIDLSDAEYQRMRIAFHIAEEAYEQLAKLFLSAIEECEMRKVIEWDRASGVSR